MPFRQNANKGARPRRGDRKGRGRASGAARRDGHEVVPVGSFVLVNQAKRVPELDDRRSVPGVDGEHPLLPPGRADRKGRSYIAPFHVSMPERRDFATSVDRTNENQQTFTQKCRGGP